jgi:hypothetical protein
MPAPRRLYRVRDPMGVVADVPGCSALGALLVFHNEALGRFSVRVRDGQIIFRDPDAQRACAGKWVIVEQGANNAGPPWVVTIPEPPPVEG